MLRALALLVLIAFTSAAPAAPPEHGIFELDSQRPQQAVLTVSDDLPADFASPPAAGLSSPMLMNLSGVIGSLSGPQLNLLTASVKTGGKPPEVTAEFRRICVAHLLDRAGKPAKRVELFTGPMAVVVAREFPSGSSKPGPGSSARAVQLDAEKYRQLSIGWARYRGPLEAGSPGLSDASAQPLATSADAALAELVKPLLPAPLYFDEKTFSDRFISGGKAKPLKTSRLPAQEKFFLRTPARYDAAKPVGLLMWINAGPEGRPPAVFNKALDELNIACVGFENAGNDRLVADRYQLAVDALFAVSERVHVDPRRVYLSGISGGGRVTTRLACCMPDYFTGSVPIVGTSAYFDIPVGDNKYSRAGFDKPIPARFTLLRTRRIGPITGKADPNYTEITATARLMNADKLQVHVFDFEGLGHQMPNAEQFTEALKWVDQPYQDTAAKETEGAKALLDAYIQKWGDIAPPAKDQQARAELVKVTQTGPWSPAAWHAVKLLSGSR